jgi:hypothetical protein
MHDSACLANCPVSNDKTESPIFFSTRIFTIQNPHYKSTTKMVHSQNRPQAVPYTRWAHKNNNNPMNFNQRQQLQSTTTMNSENAHQTFPWGFRQATQPTIHPVASHPVASKRIRKLLPI